ncbi:MAG: exodeoxyribonuclease VII small subunit [Clostridia bacterium]|nr:exodeoxyribonuclease VII small subunit [Clostridia bacterium]
MTFESALERLEQVVRQLESDNVPLDDLMKLYDEGHLLIRFCNEKLANANRKVKLVREQDGTAVFEDFDS